METRCMSKSGTRFLRLFARKALSQFGAPLASSPRTRIRMSSTHAGRRRQYDGLLLDAGGTLLQLARPVEETYASIGRKYGLVMSESEIKQGFKRAFAAPWPKKLRYEVKPQKGVGSDRNLNWRHHKELHHIIKRCFVDLQGDGRPFWRHLVSEATGCDDNDYFEEVYEHFARGDAWQLPTGTYETLHELKDAGVKLEAVSNFDTRLRKLLKDLRVADLLDATIISSEVGYEKPAPEIFNIALDKIELEASRVVHIGDDKKADKDGANAVGINCWLWGLDVKDFAVVRERILSEER